MVLADENNPSTRLLLGLLVVVIDGLCRVVHRLNHAAIIYQTGFRTIVWDYPPLGFVAIAYGFVYALVLGSSYLVRNRGHIYIEILTAMLSPHVGNVLSRFIVALCATICFIWVWYS